MLTRRTIFLTFGLAALLWASSLIHDRRVRNWQRELDTELLYALTMRRASHPPSIAWMDERVRLLLRQGADVNARPERGQPLLAFAVGCDAAPSTIEILLAAGADPNSHFPEWPTTASATTPLALARAKGRSEIVRLLKQHGARSQ
jgi:hypothetical protein